MKISIITIAYNAADTIEATIQSVVDQDYHSIEYIIIDGASSDKTMDIVRRYKDRITTIVSEKDQGIYDAMNKGVARATGDLIGILNADDLYAYPTVISEVVARIQAEGTEALYADLVYVDRANTDKVTRRWISGPYRKGAFKKGWMPPHPTFFLSRAMYEQYGSYNLQLRSSADYELMLRMIHKAGVSLSYLPKTITRMRVGGQSNISLRNRLAANKEDRLAWAINGLRPGPFTMIRKPLSKLSQFLKK